MSRYIIHFSKEGYIKYTSHLDMLRLFKRAFKRAGIMLEYSQGFNPHPKMGFAQPLSLGYTSHCEMLEFSTVAALPPQEIKEKLSAIMPEGITVDACTTFDMDIKSLAAAVREAEYQVTFPVPADIKYEQMVNAYLEQPQILAMKRQKKTKKMVEVDIKSKIRKLCVKPDHRLVLSMVLDSGSHSNLSPEQVISSFLEFSKLDVVRFDIEVERTKITI